MGWSACTAAYSLTSATAADRVISCPETARIPRAFRALTADRSMTMPPLSASTMAPNSKQAPQKLRVWPLASLLTAALLAACSTTPLPPWPARAPAPPPRNAVVVPAPLRPGVVQTAPTGQPVPLPVPLQAGTLQDLPYSAAVAARFPDPVVRYSTPGLAEQRRAFTTNAELNHWLEQIADMPSRSATRAAVLRLGPSQRGEPISALVLTRARDTHPDSLAATKRPTVLLIGQQHGDEPAGSEALLVIAQELAQGLLEPLLDQINVVIVPRANPDGAATGTRSTANGVDMNRDHLLLNTPEAQALAVLARDYRPILVLDAHEFTVAGRYLQKFNAIQRHDVLLQYATTANVHEFLTKASNEWYHTPMLQALKDQGLSTEWYYTTSSRPDDLRVSMGGVQPDTGRNVNGLKNAVSLLVETRGIGIGRAHIQRRVHSQISAIGSALRSTAERAARLEQVRSYVVRDTIAQACRDQVVVEAAQTPEKHALTMLDPETGEDRILNVDWNSSLKLHTVKSRARPCGYWLSADATVAVDRLRLLGVQVLRVAEPGALLADTYQETSRETGARQDVRGPMAGSDGIVRSQVALVRSAIDVPAGSFYVPLNQTLANLAVAALEPDTQSSYYANRLIERLDDSARIMGTPSLVFEEMQ